MRKLCLTALLVLALPMFSYATVLTFGPLCSGNCSSVLLGTYGGFTWSSNMYAEGNGAYMSGWGNTYGAPSGGAAFNGFGQSPTSMSSGTPFTFDGAAFTAWAGNDTYQSYSSLNVTVLAYDSSSTFLGLCSQTLSASSYNFLTCNITNVSTLVFHNDGTAGHWWLMDNFTYNGATVPEPGTMLMFGSGVVGLAGLLRRRINL